jgi:ATP-dependent Clp protease ATP-binding subunit ClpC
MIIMTSNVGAAELISRTAMGFSDEKEKLSDNRAIEAIRQSFAPELLNRIDDIIVFHPLTEANLMKISSLALEELKKRASAIGIELEFTENVIKSIAAANETEKYGARPVRRKVAEFVENRLAQMIVDSELTRGDIAKVDTQNGEISITKTVTV